MILFSKIVIINKLSINVIRMRNKLKNFLILRIPEIIEWPFKILLMFEKFINLQNFFKKLLMDEIF